MPPIVEKMYEVNRWLLQKVGKFPRDQRFLLGERLMQKSLDIQECLVAAALKGRSEEKSRLLADISLALEQVRYLLRLARDSRCLSQDSWFFCVKNLAEIGKMLGGVDEECLNVTTQVPHPLLRSTFPQEGKETKTFPLLLGGWSQSSQHWGRQRR
ncbi:MAG: four helix bundle protein [Elusimicrobia bacterium]|nr:four helix bundle protein [Elusimicrobiota bacterium]